MSSEWQTLPIGEIGKVVTGKTPSTAVDHYYGGEFPFYTPSDMDGRKRLESTKRSLSNEGIDSIRGSIIEAGAVMVSCIGSDMGKVAIAANKGATNQQINTILVSQGFDPEYIYYELSTRKDELQMLATGGSAQPILNKGNFCQIEICVPSLPEQRAIAHILGTLDDKIELNRKTNETLEAMAKALFKSWFVDFDPVRAKAEGRPTGLPADISDLFPDSFEDSELGEIPSGWKFSSLGEEFNWREGKPWNKEDRVERSAISVFGANGSIGFGSRQMGDSRVIFIGKIGSCGAINYHNGLFWATNNTHFISLEENPFLEYARQVLRVVDFSQYIGGSSNPYMPYGNFAHHQIPSPSSDLLRIFCDSVTPLRESIEQREEASKTLCALRNALLPKLISGEIRIPDAEKLLEEVVS